LMDIQKSLAELNDKVSRMEQDRKNVNPSVKDT